MLFYGYATGVFSLRKIERATYESIPFRFLSGHLPPDHDTIANFRRRFLDQIKGLFVQVLLLAVETGVLRRLLEKSFPKGGQSPPYNGYSCWIEAGIFFPGNLLTLDDVSLDGTKIHTDASKSKAISYGHLVTLRAALEAEVEALLKLSEAAAAPLRPEGVNVRAEIERRRQKLVNLTQAEAVLQARAEERYQSEKAEYEAKLAERAARRQQTGRQSREPAPKPPL